MAITSHTSLNSTNLNSYGYDEETNTLEITFQSGRTYQYMNVPASIAYDLGQAGSPGSFFHASIKNAYQSKEI